MNIWEQAGLAYRFEQIDGAKLVLDRPEGRMQDVIIPFQSRMLQANSIPHFVPLIVEPRDNSCLLRYSLEGRRRLSSVLPASDRKEEKVLRILFALTEAAEEGRNYLLQEEGIVLHPDWIWTDTECREIQFLYAPIRSFGQGEAVWRQWQALCVFLGENGASQSLKELLRPDQWTAQSFSLRLIAERLRRGRQDRYPEANLTASEEEQAFLPITSNIGVVAEEPQPDHKPSEPSAMNASLQDRSVFGSSYSTADDGETMRFTVPRLTWKEGIGAASAFSGWLAYAFTLSTGWFIVAVGLSIPIGVVLARRYQTPRPSVLEQPTPSVERREDAFESPARAMNAPLADRTALLRPPEKTVLLSELGHGQEAVFDAEPAPCLEIRSEHVPESTLVVISELPFRIGRGPEGVHYIVDHNAVSRVHLEIRREAGDAAFTIHDAGSRNGSFMNDGPMIPHQPVTLEKGSVLRIPGAEMVFRFDTSKKSI